jgi:hypothetical protein
MPYTFSADENLEIKITLHSCEADDAPEYADHHQVLRLGDIKIRFSDRDKRLAKQRFDAEEHCTLYRFDFILTMRKHTDGGLLEFRTTVAGKEVGSATITF